MIRIFLGNAGSGKTACAVREMTLNENDRKTYSNIITKGLKNNIVIKPEMIIVKEDVENSKKHKLSLNKQFWEDIHEPINVILDEAHSLMNARRSMSSVNIIITDWLAMIRRVLGSADSGYGNLILITQLPNRIDIIARDMATQVRYHICHYYKLCRKCGYYWKENNEIPEPLWLCPICSSARIKKCHHSIEIWHFRNMNSYMAWHDFAMASYYRHYFIDDIERYFKHYNTLQWEYMFSELY